MRQAPEDRRHSLRGNPDISIENKLAVEFMAGSTGHTVAMSEHGNEPCADREYEKFTRARSKMNNPA